MEETDDVTGNIDRKLKITVKASAYKTQPINSDVSVNYSNDVTSTLAKEDITVFINGVEVTSTINPEVEVSSKTTTTNPTSTKKEDTYIITLSNMGEARRVAGVPYKEWSGNVSIKIAGRGEDSNTYNSDVLYDAEGNRYMMEIDQGGTWIDVKYGDTDSWNTNTELGEDGDGRMFIDYIKPEFTYKYSNTVIGNGPTGNKKVEVIFDIVDRYFKQSTLDEEDISIIMADYDNTEIQNALDLEFGTLDRDLVVGNITYKQNGDIYYKIKGEDVKIGKRYKLIISGLEKLDNKGMGDGDKYSGFMNIVIDSEIAEDNSGNKNDTITLNIGIDEDDGDYTTNDGGNQEIVDVVDPIWESAGTSGEPGEITIRAKDKYFQSAEIDEDDIVVYSNGLSSPEIGITISDPSYVKLDGSGNYVAAADESEADAVEYTITLSNVTVENADHIEFTPTDENGNPIEIIGGKPQYVQENGGQVKVEVAAGTAVDTSGNVNKKTIFDMGFMDDTRPEVYDIQKTQNEEDETVTMIFNTTDRNYDPSDLVEPDEIEIWLDGKLVGDTNGNGQLDAGETCQIQKNLTSIPIRAAIDNTVKILGHQYTLVLSDIVETQAQYIANGRDFRELSGTLEIRIKDDAAKDLNGNKLNPEKLAINDFVDFIKPEVTYKYSQSSQAVPGDINYSGKTFTMVFDIIDKYFKESTLTINDLEIKIDGTEPDWRETGETTGVTKNLTYTDIKETFNKTLPEDENNNGTLDTGEDKNGNGILDNYIASSEYVIGKRYTLVLSNLEQLEILQGQQYLDYSGVINVTIPVEKITDTTGNSNVRKTIISGIDIVGDVTDTGDDEVTVDVVDPLWEKVESSANAINQTATITIRGTDKYYASSNLTGKIKVYAHTGTTPGATGLTDITEDVTITGINTATPVYKTGTTEQIGDEYTLTITGFAKDVNQIKIAVLEDAMLDTSGNGNKDGVTQGQFFIAYNTLKLTSSETGTTSGFLGETTIQRQNIHKVIFVNNLSGSTGATKVWDASAAGDASIKAWTTQNSAPYTVYIGSDDEIFANQNSSYLLSYIGYGENSTETTAVTGLEYLNTNSVTNMSYMFNNFGYRTMTTLNLGKLDTTNVTDMTGMFQNCGQTALTTLDLSATDLTFKTNNVENMSNMFSGQKAITSFNLGSNFNTAKVTNMSGMFQDFGLSLTTLSLGNNFFTSEVTDMSNMFKGCGATAMTTLDLGTNFNTAKVTIMSGMFQGFAQNSETMTILDLGDNFYTTATTNMSNMFNSCGTEAMEILDLGPAFTKLASTNTGFVTDCGTSETVIKVAESIYKDMKNLKLDTDSTDSAANYTVGTINPAYKPEWSKVSVTTNASAGTMEIVVKGKVDSTIYGTAVKTITSSITAGNDTSNLINVLVDGEVAETITQTVTVDSVTSTEVQYTITLSAFEETTGRQDNKNFKEWSGNVALQFVKGALVDAYGNKNMVQIDIDPDGDGTTEIKQIQIKDDTLRDTNDIVSKDKMFADYIKPEFTYEYCNIEVDTTVINPDIDYEGKTVTIVFDVTDKYFKTTKLLTDTSASLITIKVDGTELVGDLNKNGIKDTGEDIVATLSKIEDLYHPVNGVTTHKVGQKYQLVITGLEGANGEGFSGPMSLIFPAETIEDNSGNKSEEQEIKIGIDEPENHPEHNEQIIVDLVRPVWNYAISSIDRTNNTVTVTVLGSDKYYDPANTLIESTDIKVKVDGTEISTITSDPVKITDETQLQTLATNAGLNDVKVGYAITLSTFGTVNGETEIIIAEDTIKDKSGNGNEDTPISVGNVRWTETGDDSANPKYPAFRQDIVDFIKPEIKYQYSAVENAKNPNIDYALKKVTVKFTVADKYLLTSDLIDTGNVIKNISILVDGDDVTDKVATNISGVNTANGRDYTLIVSNLQQTPNNAFDFSGPMQLVFEPNVIDDTSGNKNVSTTITIDTDDGDNPNDGVIVDVVSPIWEMVESSVETGILKLRAKDKYFASSSLRATDITVYVNGVVSTVIGKEIGEPSYFKLDESGNFIPVANVAEADAVEYIVQLTNVTVDNAGYEEFTPTNIEEDELFNEPGFKYKYRKENGGQIKIEVAANTALDESGNGNIATPFDVGGMDSTNPEVHEVKNIQAEVANTDTIIFNVTDRNYDSSDLVEIEEIDIFVDGTEIDWLIEGTNALTRKPIKANLDNTTKIVGHQYTLVLSDIAETYAEFVASGRKIQELSGTIQVKIAENAAKDLNGNSLKPESTTISDFVDYIIPNITYKYTASDQGNPGDIDYEGKTFTMVFEIVDKYIKESPLETALAGASTDAEKQEIIEEYLTILIDGEEPDWTMVDKELTITDVKQTINKTVSGVIVSNTEQVIGKKFELKLSHLEQLQIKENDHYLDYSGVITVDIKAGTIIDEKDHGNIAKTITSGVDIPGGVIGTDDQIVDVVDPLWEKVSSSAYAKGKTTTITVRGTDKYLADTTLEENDIQLLVNGNVVTEGITIETLSDPTYKKIDGNNNLVTTTNQAEAIGVEYTITIEGYAEIANQVKVRIKANAIKDDSENGNKQTDLIVYNVLKTTNAETTNTSKFLGSTSIQRQQVEKVIFVNNTDASTSTDVKTKWDVSAQGDNSILAWTLQSSAPYTVYIGSDDEIFANQDSSYLFSYIGYGEICSTTATTTIQGIELLNTSSVTNMSYMFNNFGYRRMTALNLGDFDTTNVTNMSNMFNSCGNMLMTTLNLGTTFNTSNVTDMSNMFKGCGQNAMTNIYFGDTTVTEGEITLPDNFNTAKVTNMSGMFQDFGKEKVVKLSLGNSFHTNEVTDMSNMFNGCGQTEMTTFSLGGNFNTIKVENMSGMFKDFGTGKLEVLNLGTKFNTYKVEDMSSMFQNCGQTEMPSLDLGELFFTTSATKMNNMFNGCGSESMVALDLGPAFTNVATQHTDFMTNCGTEGLIIYAPEAIYENKTSFK